MKTDPQAYHAKIRKEFEIISTPPRTKISLWFDDYDEIFSDFDPRSYSHRVISDDFLNELRKVVSEVNTGKFDIVFLIPRSKISVVDEKIIKSRLHNYFHGQTEHFQSESKKLVKKGILITLLGMAVMFLTAILISKIEDKFFSNLLTVMFEPTGWFAVWYGLDHLFYLANDNKEILGFSKKMVAAEIIFNAY